MGQCVSLIHSRVHQKNLSYLYILFYNHPSMNYLKLSVCLCYTLCHWHTVYMKLYRKDHQGNWPYKSADSWFEVQNEYVILNWNMKRVTWHGRFKLNRGDHNISFDCKSELFFFILINIFYLPFSFCVLLVV